MKQISLTRKILFSTTFMCLTGMGFTSGWASDISEELQTESTTQHSTQATPALPERLSGNLFDKMTRFWSDFSLWPKKEKETEEAKPTVTAQPEIMEEPLPPVEFPTTLSQSNEKPYEVLTDTDQEKEQSPKVIITPPTDLNALKGLKPEQLKAMLEALELRARDQGEALNNLSLTESVIDNSFHNNLPRSNNIIKYSEIPADEKPCGNFCNKDAEKGTIYPSYIYWVNGKNKKAKAYAGDKLALMGHSAALDLNRLNVTKIETKNGKIVYQK